MFKSIKTTFLLCCIFISVSFADQREIVSERSERSKVFDNQDGTYTLQSTMYPVHYKIDRGNRFEAWKDIDVTIPADLRLEKAPYRAEFKTTHPEYVIRHRNGDYLTQEFVTENEAKVSKPGTIEGNKIVYRNVMPNIDVEIVAFHTGVKQNIILKNSGALSNRWRVKYSSDKSAISVGDKKLRFGKIIDITKAYDKDGQPVQLSYRVRATNLEIAPINISADQFPITIDPMTVVIFE